MTGASAAVSIRPEVSADEDAVAALLRAAFGSPDEARLLRSLRRSGDLIETLVAIGDDRICGHAAFCRLGLRTTAGAEQPVVCLAPLAVAPQYQRRGVGTRLVETGLRKMAAAGEGIVFVLGDPAYYGRFGFSSSAAKPYRSPFSNHARAAHLALRLKPGGLIPEAGELRYPAVFSAFI